jgi:alkylhydroperoxidase family enzyme
VTISRIPLLSAEETKTAAAEGGVPEYMTDLNIFRLLLRHPPLARRFNALLGHLLFECALDHRLRELVIMRIGWVTGSDYEWTQHWRVGAGMFKVPEADLFATRDWRAYDDFSLADQAVLAATDEVLEHGTVTDETWAACEEHVTGGEEALLELFMAIGAWRMVSGFLRSLEVPLEDGVESWPPDGVAPDPEEVHG